MNELSAVTRSGRPSPFTSTTSIGKLEAVDAVMTGSIVRKATPLAQKARHSPWLHRSAPVHAVLHAPQWVAFVWVLTQLPPHDVMQPVEQMPLVPHTPRSLAVALLQTAHVGPQPST